jgi:hypothetical protein
MSARGLPGGVVSGAGVGAALLADRPYLQYRGQVEAPEEERSDLSLAISQQR